MMTFDLSLWPTDPSLKTRTHTSILRPETSAFSQLRFAVLMENYDVRTRTWHQILDDRLSDVRSEGLCVNFPIEIYLKTGNRHVLVEVRQLQTDCH